MLDRVISLLSPAEKKLLHQVAGKGMSYEEIALLWSGESGQEVSPAAVRQRYFRLRETLKRLVEAER